MRRERREEGEKGFKSLVQAEGEEESGVLTHCGTTTSTGERACQKSQIMLAIEKPRQRGCLRPFTLKKLKIGGSGTGAEGWEMKERMEGKSSRMTENMGSGESDSEKGWMEDK